MRRIVPVLALIAGVASCDPTGNIITTSTSSVRVVNLVTDTPTLLVRASGITIGTPVAFGAVTDPDLVSTEDSVFALSRTSDNFVIGADTVSMLDGRRYTFYAFGIANDHRFKFATDDTLFGAAGQYKFRFIHGTKTKALQGLDLYVSLASDSLTALTPQITSLGYGLASGYVAADTGFKRIRITVTGTTTTLLDTTLSTAIADSTNLSIVISDKSGGGTPYRLGLVVDNAP